MSAEPTVGTGSSGPDRVALARCIGVEPAEFAEHYWSNRPLHSPAAVTGACFDDLFGVDAVDELVSRRGLRTPFVRMAKQGSVLPATRYTRSGGVGATIADQIADDLVFGQLADGATLVLQALHRTWPPLVEFGNRLAVELGHPVQINAYVTPAQNQGFAAHYDTHDVFVLQIAGAKQWRVHDPVLEDPLPEQVWEQHRDLVAARAAEPPLLDVTLRPGDALYLPRGYLHSAAALGELTVHLTIGVHPLTRHALVRRLLAVATDDRELRRSLPMGRDLSDPAVLSGEWAATVQALIERVAADSDGLLDRLAADLGAELADSTRPQPIAPLALLDAIAAVSAHTAVQVRPGLRVRVEHDGGEIVLRWLRRSLRLPAEQQAAVKAALAGTVLTPAELPGLDAPEQLALTVRLLREAVLVPAPAAGG